MCIVFVVCGIPRTVIVVCHGISDVASVQQMNYCSQSAPRT